jgi:hypothetical protein
MITPLTPAEMVAAIGRAARAAARTDEPLSEFERSQLMSAYSGSRHLAVEIEFFPPAVDAFCTGLADELDATPVVELPELAAVTAQLRDTADPRRAGEVVSGLLNLLRAHPSPAAAALRARVQAALRDLCDREVDLLADALERR